MKIAIICQELNVKTSSRIILDLAIRLSKKNKVYFICFKDKLDANLRKILDISRIEARIIPHSPISSLRLFSELKKIHPDVISFHSSLIFFLIAKLSGFPIVKTYYGTQFDAYLEKFNPDYKPNLSNRLVNFLGNKFLFITERIQFLLSDQIVGISKYTASETERIYKRKIPFIYLGADSVFLKVKENKQKKSNIFTILSVSRITPYKGFHLLAKILKRVQDELKIKIKLIIAGSCNNKSYLGYLRKVLPVNSQILTNVSMEKLSELYSQSDLYVSLDRYLFFGLPPLEAALFKKPSLVMNYCAANEIVVNEKTGFVANSENEFIKKLKVMIEDENLLQTMGENSYKRTLDAFNWDDCSEQYENLFKKIKI